jgi:hypothetical protein
MPNDLASFRPLGSHCWGSGEANTVRCAKGASRAGPFCLVRVSPSIPPHAAGAAWHASGPAPPHGLVLLHGPAWK